MIFRLLGGQGVFSIHGLWLFVSTGMMEILAVLGKGGFLLSETYRGARISASHIAPSRL